MNTHALAVMGICAAVTLATRALPFVCFSQKRAVPRLVTSLGHSLPPAIMAALVVYCLKSVPFGTLSSGRHSAHLRSYRCSAAHLAAQHAAEHRRGHRAVYGAHPPVICAARRAEIQKES